MLHAFFKQWKHPHPSWAYPFLRHLQPKRDTVTGECIVWNFTISTPHQILFGLIDQNNEKGQTCRIYGSIQGFGGKNLRERNHLEDLGINGRMEITLMFIFKK